jgi:hypothetical protein
VPFPLGARVGALQPDERLYVGAQTQDRMFRGDNCGGENFHHNELRTGNGMDTPVAYLRSNGKVAIHRVSAQAIAGVITKTPELANLRPLLNQPVTARKHIGYWCEQYILLTEADQWRWNTDAADSAVGKLIGYPPGQL